ncbi:GH1 family beta-glucosidase [Nonomuraea soli]|uniref:Beta-glucosidase n=1 Tax=Nonomuraea soli TaxID=1032476 RepID=A0A7W0HPU1_9ACTN|nr:GH1 family beta-glucosidase [Nonomuraea soli]MBA2891112.1 beta-galactosidase [Nonomuraea soli]
MKPTALTFPRGFVWGAGTSAYQIEGAAKEDGRGPSIWDGFAPAHGDTGEVACDHYHRYREDVALMKELGLAAYRFSVAWPRVQPDGRGAINTGGLDFYDRLTDELLAAGIAPYVTLYHWDLPRALEDDGGWTSRDTAWRFADYARAVHARLGDRVDTWLTVNEPFVQASLGYGIGLHAPGRLSPAETVFAVGHHMLLAHGLGVRALRAEGARRIGIPLNLSPVLTPDQVADPSATLPEPDAHAVEQVDAVLNRQFLDAVLRGKYPAGLPEAHVRPGDLEIISEPIDVLGVNYYAPTIVRAEPGAPPNPAYPGVEGVRFSDSHVTATAMGWPIVPNGLSLLLRQLARRYPGVELVVAENGAAFSDVVRSGAVADADRTAFLDEHLRAVRHAIADGVPCKGYFVWSLMDNFEWAEGYRRTFGIVHVDFDTQLRTVKDSGRWYREVIRHNGLPVSRPKRPTLETVAARAGVSRATVSRVVNGENSVSPEIREAVLHAVNQLGYVPNAAARNLVTQRTETVALVLATSPERDDAGIGTLVMTAGQAIQAAGKRITLLLADTEHNRSTLVSHVESGHVDGVLLAPHDGADPLISRLYGTAVPMVLLGKPAFSSLVPCVDIDNAGGGALATRHLMETGRTRIAMVCGPMEQARVRDRLAGYREAMREAGLQPFLTVGEHSQRSGAEAVRRLLDDDPGVQAVFASSDVMALGVLRAVREAGRDDVAVVGFGDVQAAAYAGLSTISERAGDQALTLARLLLSRLEGRPVSSALLSAQLIVRESSRA